MIKAWKESKTRKFPRETLDKNPATAKKNRGLERKVLLCELSKHGCNIHSKDSRRMLISLESLQIFFFFISQLLSFSYLLVLGSQTILKKSR